MKKQITPQEALHKAAALCSSGEKSEYDIREKLQAWGISEDKTDETIKYLIQEKFLDDSRFALFFVKDKFRFNKWGKIKIGFTLKQKQIAPSLIQEALNSIDEDEYAQTLLEIMQSKLKGLKYKDDYDKQGKLFRFAQSRGFENSIITEILKKM